MEPTKRLTEAQITARKLRVYDRAMYGLQNRLKKFFVSALENCHGGEGGAVILLVDHESNIYRIEPWDKAQLEHFDRFKEFVAKGNYIAKPEKPC